VLFKGSTEAANKCIEASPGLAERARARCRRIRVAKEGAELGVDFGFSKLIKVTQELEDVGPTAPGEGERGAVVPEVLAKGVPVSPLLVLIAAESGGGGGGGGGGDGGGRGGGGGGGGVERDCDCWVCCGTAEVLNRVHICWLNLLEG